MKKLLLIKCAAIGTFLIIAAAIFVLFGTYTRTDTEPLFWTPSLYNTNGWELYTVENGMRKQLTIKDFLKLEKGKTYYLSRMPDKETENSGYTFLRLPSNLPCAVFLEGQLLYTTCPGSVLSIDRIMFPDGYEGLSGRGEAVLCTLPAHFAGKRLTIATTTGSMEYGPSLPGIMLSSETVESENAMAGAGHEMIPAAGLAGIALLLLIIWLFAFSQKVYNYEVLLPITAALLQMLSHLRLLEFRSSSPTALASPLTQFIPAASLLLPLVYFLLQIKEKRNRMIFGCILGISSVIAFLPPTAVLLGIPSFHSAFFTENEILYLPMAALLIFAVLEVKHKNTALRLFLSGLGITISGIAVLYIGSLSGKGYYAGNIATILRSAAAHSPSTFWDWCSMILFLLSALISLHKIIRHTAQVHTNLALQTERSEQLDRQLTAQKEFYDARLGHEKEIRALRHDMDGHLNTLTMLLCDGRVAEAKSYLDGIAAYHNGHTSKLYSSNPYVNAVIQNYAAKCLEHHIELVCHIGIGDCELPATELCLILNNAFENALDASLALPETDRKIKVQAAVRQDLFLLRVSNPFDGNVKTDNGLPVTTKRGIEHGYGLSNIRQAAEHIGGSMEYHIQNGYFVLDVEFPVISAV